MVGSYLIIDEPEIWLESTSAGADPGDNGRGEGIGNNNGESHQAPLLAPPPPPPPPPMTHVEMMVEMMAA